MLPLVLAGATGLHVHEDGTCHAHPIAPNDDHHDEGSPFPAPCDRHTPGDGVCVRLLFPTEDGVGPHATVALLIEAEPGPGLRLSDGNSYLLACGPPAGIADLPLYLSHRRLLI